MVRYRGLISLLSKQTAGSAMGKRKAFAVRDPKTHQPKRHTKRTSPQSEADEHQGPEASLSTFSSFVYSPLLPLETQPHEK
jgi:hypothetical protein